MMKRLLNKRLFSTLNNQQKKLLEFNPIEYEPFKFQKEREQLMYGYTMEELYGAKYGFRHSPAVKREIAKDSIVLVLSVLATIYWALCERAERYEQENCWDNYLYHDQNTVRNNIK